MRTLVRVTNQDIKTGKRMDARKCPVVKAIEWIYGKNNAIISYCWAEVYDPTTGTFKEH